MRPEILRPNGGCAAAYEAFSVTPVCLGAGTCDAEPSCRYCLNGAWLWIPDGSGGACVCYGKCSDVPPQGPSAAESALLFATICVYAAFLSSSVCFIRRRRWAAASGANVAALVIAQVYSLAHSATDDAYSLAWHWTFILLLHAAVSGFAVFLEKPVNGPRGWETDGEKIGKESPSEGA